MKIEIDTKECNKLGVSPMELFYMICIYNNVSTEFDRNTLLESSYITEDDELTSKTTKLFNTDVSEDMIWFVKTYDNYPHKVGDRVLKSKSINSAEGKYCMNKYKNYLKRKEVDGEKMFKGLLVEISLAKKGNKEEYYQNIKTWFNQRSWEKYQDLEIATNVERFDAI